MVGVHRLHSCCVCSCEFKRRKGGGGIEGKRDQGEGTGDQGEGMGDQGEGTGDQEGGDGRPGGRGGETRREVAL